LSEILTLLFVLPMMIMFYLWIIRIWCI